MTEPTAYIYEQRIVPDKDEWKETTSIEHPQEREKEYDDVIEIPDYRNVRPLYEHNTFNQDN